MAWISPQVAFFDQIEERKPAIGVVFGDVHQATLLDSFLARIELPLFARHRVVGSLPRR